MKGYKIIPENWVCSPAPYVHKKYDCPSFNSEFVDPIVSESGMHFSSKLCYALTMKDYQEGDHIVEVNAIGQINSLDIWQACTDWLEIVREISPQEAVEILSEEICTEDRAKWTDIMSETQATQECGYESHFSENMKTLESLLEKENKNETSNN